MFLSIYVIIDCSAIIHKIMLKKLNTTKVHLLRYVPIRNITHNEDEVSLTYSDMIYKLTRIEIPKNYMNTKFSDIVKHIETDINKTPSKSKSLAIKSRDYTVDQENYMNYLAKNPVGTYEVFKHKNRQIKIMGFNYSNMLSGNLWKLMLLSQCDVILLAARPDLLLKDFKLNVKNPKTKGFSNRLYYNQLELDPSEILTNKETEDRIAKHIDTFFLSNKPHKIQSSENSRTLDNYICFDKLTNEAFSTATLFAKRKSVPIVLADMPDILYREHIANPLTVAQFKQLFSEATIETVINPDLQPETPLNANLSRLPEFTLQPTDSYISSLVEYIIKTKNYKKILVVGGLGQSFGIKSILQNRLPLQLEEVLAPPELNSNIYGQKLLEEFVEKQSIYDVFSLGKLIMQKNETLFKNSHALIEKYSGLDSNHPKLSYYKNMHSDFVHHYFKLFAKQQQKGLEKKEDYFIQKSIELQQR